MYFLFIFNRNNNFRINRIFCLFVCLSCYSFKINKKINKLTNKIFNFNFKKISFSIDLGNNSNLV
jgi:hypothetical protein